MPNAAALSPDVLLDPSSLNTLPACFGDAVNAASVKLVLDFSFSSAVTTGCEKVELILKLRARAVAGAEPGDVGLLSASSEGSLSTEPCVDILNERSLLPPLAVGGELSRDGTGDGDAGTGCGCASAGVAVEGPTSVFGLGDGGTVAAGDTDPRWRAKNEPIPAPHVLNLSPADETVAL